MTDHAEHEREALILGGHDGELDPAAAADLSLLAELLGDSSVWAEPREELEDAVVAAVSTAERQPAASAGRRAGARRSTGDRWPRIFLAAAAAVVAVFAGAIVASRGASSPDFEGELAATDLAPDARASVEVTQNSGGFRITLDADGLDPLGSGEHYQAWLKDEAGDLVAIGTFSSSDEAITLWSGESPERFPLLSVTLEAADGDPASSGRVVLAGELHDD
jgi:Anti-sigma-K factor rskA, C-terminal